MARCVRKERGLSFGDHQLVPEWRDEACFTPSLQDAASSSSKRCNGGLVSVPTADQGHELQTFEMQLSVGNVTM